VDAVTLPLMPETLSYAVPARRRWEPARIVAWAWLVLAVPMMLASVAVAIGYANFANRLAADRRLALSSDRPPRVEAGGLSDEQRRWLVAALHDARPLDAEVRAWLVEALDEVPLPLDPAVVDSPAAVRGQVKGVVSLSPSGHSDGRLYDTLHGGLRVQRGSWGMSAGGGSHPLGGFRMNVTEAGYRVNVSSTARSHIIDGYSPAAWWEIGLSWVMLGGWSLNAIALLAAAAASLRLIRRRAKQ
jgi:hypothetical protein